MSPLTYHRPKTLTEALDLLEAGLPLAGGTALTPRRLELESLVDLEGLNLDRFEVQADSIRVGAGVRLQALVEHEATPSALTIACMQEAGWNLRNAATIGGTIMAAGGRSPLLTVLVALGARASLEPGGESVEIDELIHRRASESRRWLITEVQLPQPDYLGYEQVGRSPADRPIVCAAVAKLASASEDGRFRVALGGYGERPARVQKAEKALDRGEIEIAAGAASDAYSAANDAWASAAYRAAVAGILVRRLAEEAVGS